MTFSYCKTAVAAALLLAGAAQAADLSFQLSASKAFPDGGNYGTVALTQDGAGVDVSVQLAPTYEFVKTGNHDSFTFNIVGATGYSVTGIDPQQFSWFQPAANPALGSYTDGLECGGCSNGGSAAFNSLLTFTVNGVALADFQNNDVGYTFSADIVSSAGKTGAVAAARPVVTAVPEPATSALVLAGLGMVAFMARRRRAG